MVVRSGDVFAGFVIDRVIGSGGMGVVYLAQHPRLKRHVALKVLNDAIATDPKARTAFEREVALAARFDHPNIIAVYDRSSAEDPLLWLSMQYVRGGDANALLAADPDGLPATLATELITDAADALDVAHAQGVLHRDVKPANLLIGPGPRRSRRAILTDFGIARALDESVTASTLAVTFAYTAPERFLAQPSDHRCDIYSLGCTLHQLLTGSPPFPRGTPAAVMAAHLNDPPPSPHSIRPNLPPAIDAVIATALAKDPVDRYRSCGELADAARNAIASAPPTPAAGAHPVPTTVAQSRVPVGRTASAPVTGVAEPGAAEATGPHSSPVAGDVGQSSEDGSTDSSFTVAVGLALLGVAVLVGALVVVALRNTGSENTGTGEDHTPTPPPSATATIPFGAKPAEIELVPETSTAFISNTGDNSVSAVDTSADNVTDVGYRP